LEGIAMDTALEPDELLRKAQNGGEDSLGALLESYRHYLDLLARVEVGRRLQAKLDAADLVQETLLEAFKNFPKFRGSCERQFVCWLRQIMAACLANLLRRYMGTKARDIRLEKQLADQLDLSARRLDCGLMDGQSSPSRQASHREQAVLLANALQKLAPDYREVIILRHIESLTFPDISRRMDRSIDSVEKLWVRGLARLRQIMGANP
jgi:RNA polymerase sigma-70 factor, ECF subfamily